MKNEREDLDRNVQTPPTLTPPTLTPPNTWPIAARGGCDCQVFCFRNIQKQMQRGVSDAVRASIRGLSSLPSGSTANTTFCSGIQTEI